MVHDRAKEIQNPAGDEALLHENKPEKRKRRQIKRVKETLPSLIPPAMPQLSGKSASLDCGVVPAGEKYAEYKKLIDSRLEGERINLS